VSGAVVAIRPRALGDVVLVTPALRALALGHAGRPLEVVTDARYAPVVAGLPGVTRVWPLERSTAGTLRLALAQFRELAAFAQFGSDLDKATQAQLARGKRLVEILKQPQYQPLPVEKQVVIVFAGTNGYLDDLAVEECTEFERGLHRHCDLHHKDLLAELVQKGALDDDLKARLGQAIDAYKAEFVAQRPAVG
jgi:hypothetical protein